MSTFDQETSSNDSFDDDVKVQVIAAIELLPKSGMKKDPDKVKMSKEKVCQRFSTLKFNPKVIIKENARFFIYFANIFMSLPLVTKI